MNIQTIIKNLKENMNDVYIRDIPLRFFVQSKMTVLNCRPTAPAVARCIPGSKIVVANQTEGLTQEEEKFFQHCWVEKDNYVIDLTIKQIMQKSEFYKYYKTKDKRSFTLEEFKKLKFPWIAESCEYKRSGDNIDYLNGHLLNKIRSLNCTAHIKKKLCESLFANKSIAEKKTANEISMIRFPRECDEKARNKYKFSYLFDNTRPEILEKDIVILYTTL